jgi:hypothetical protein
MKHIIVKVCIFTMAAFNQGFGQDMTIMVAREKNSCGSLTDLGYVKVRTYQKYASDKYAKEKIMDMYPGNSWVQKYHANKYSSSRPKPASSPSTEINETQKKINNSDKMWDEEYFVIIKAITYAEGCQRVTYGIGFGYDYTKAEKNAVNDLKADNWDWSSRKHTYDIVESGLVESQDELDYSDKKPKRIISKGADMGKRG